MVHLEEFEAKTGGRLDAVDVTDDVMSVVVETGIQSGSALVFSPHTTCCVLITTPGRDLERALDEVVTSIAPEDRYYAHDDLDVRTENLVEGEPPNAPAHIAHAFIGKTSEVIPVVEGALVLDRDQRVLLVELDSSRLRRYYVQLLGQ